jgi:phosphomannomutase/phosphoglucomutase
MWKTGHSLIKAKMKETGAALAGEMSGHIFFADRYYGFDDAIYAAMRIVEVYSRSISEGKIESFSDLLSDLPKVYSTPEIRFPCTDSLKFEMVHKLKDKLVAHISRENNPRIVNLIDVDGVRAEFEDGWGLLRASNTQPVLVMRFESSKDEYLKKYRRFFETILQQLEDK